MSEQVTITFRLDPDLTEFLRQTAAREYRSLNRQVEMILDEWRRDRLLLAGTSAAGEGERGASVPS